MAAQPIPQGAQIDAAPQAVPIPQGADIEGSLADESHAEVRAHPGGVAQWLTDLESDLRYGGTQTAIGRGLKKIGYQGAESLGGEEGTAGKTIISPLTGPVFAAHGVVTGKPLEVLSGIGEAAELPMQFAAPETKELEATAQVPGASSLARRMYQSALKPSIRLNPAKTEQAISTGLQEAIPVSKAGAEKLSALIEDVNDAIANEIGSGKGKTINSRAVASRLPGVSARFADQVNPETDLEAVRSARAEFLRNQPDEIPAAEAQSLKQGTYAQLKDKAYGELKSASIEAQKALARGIKEELNAQFPELADLNQRDSNLYNLESVLEKAVAREGNHQLGGIGTPLAAAGAKAVTNSNKVAAVTGALKAILDNPNVKSRLAIALNRAGVPLAVANGRVAAYVANLGDIAASSETPDSRTSQQP